VNDGGGGPHGSFGRKGEPERKFLPTRGSARSRHKGPDQDRFERTSKKKGGSARVGQTPTLVEGEETGNPPLKGLWGESKKKKGGTR